MMENGIPPKEEILEKLEDVAERVIKIFRPHARSIAKVSSVFFHIIMASLLILEFENASYFLGRQLGLVPYRHRLQKSENEDGTEGSDHPRYGDRASATFSARFVVLLIILSRVIPLGLIFQKRHIVWSCVSLSLFPVLLAIIYVVERPSITAFFTIFTCLSLVGSTSMLVAETFEETDTYLAGLPSLGVNKKMSVVQLLARVNLVLTFLGVHMIYMGLHKSSQSQLTFWLQMLFVVPLVGCVVVGYRTRLTAVLVATWLLLASLISYPFYLHLAQGRTWGFWLEAGLFSVNMQAVGSLAMIAILGAGTYSVDHMKNL